MALNDLALLPPGRHLLPSSSHTGILPGNKHNADINVIAIVERFLEPTEECLEFQQVAVTGWLRCTMDSTILCSSQSDFRDTKATMFKDDSYGEAILKPESTATCTVKTEAATLHSVKTPIGLAQSCSPGARTPAFSPHTCQRTPSLSSPSWANPKISLLRHHIRCQNSSIMLGGKDEQTKVMHACVCAPRSYPCCFSKQPRVLKVSFSKNRSAFEARHGGSCL
nr:uncharacterized protein LOC129397350 [Pan paniscus]